MVLTTGKSICDSRNKAKCHWTTNQLKDFADWTSGKRAAEIKSKGLSKMVNSIINQLP